MVTINLSCQQQKNRTTVKDSRKQVHIIAESLKRSENNANIKTAADSDAEGTRHLWI